MPVVTRSSVWQASPYCPPESRTQLSVLSDAAVSADSLAFPAPQGARRDQNVGLLSQQCRDFSTSLTRSFRVTARTSRSRSKKACRSLRREMVAVMNIPQALDRWMLRTCHSERLYRARIAGCRNIAITLIDLRNGGLSAMASFQQAIIQAWRPGVLQLH